MSVTELAVIDHSSIYTFGLFHKGQRLNLKGEPLGWVTVRTVEKDHCWMVNSTKNVNSDTTEMKD